MKTIRINQSIKQMKVSKLTMENVKEIKQASFYQQLDRIRSGDQSNESKVALLEALRQEIRNKISNLRDLRGFLKQESSQVKVEVNEPDLSESQLWDSIDGVQYKIIDRRDQKIYLNSVLEQYQEELFEQGRVIEQKRTIDTQLKQAIEVKRMILEKTRCASNENSLSGSVTSLPMRSPRLFGSPRLYQEVHRVLAWR